MVVSKNAYLTLEEMKENVSYIYYKLVDEAGWSVNAVCGMLGNMQTESTINPGIWQGLNENWLEGGFGLVQWTPATKYITWAEEFNYPITSIDGQLARLDFEIDNNLQWITTSLYPMTFAEFKVSTESPEYLAQVFLRNYERPKESHQPKRSEQARFWWNWVHDSGFPPPNELDHEIADFPMDMIHITQGENGTFSHMGTLCIDFVGTHDKYPYFAPCKVKCTGINKSPYHYVIWSTVDPVLCADGQVRHFTFSCIHENPVWQTLGMTLEKGQLMGHTGNGGATSTGDHWHLQVIEGNRFLGFTTNAQGASTLRGKELHIYDVFSVDGVKRVNDYGYDWKIVEGNYVPKPPSTKKDFIPLWLLKVY